MFWRSVEVVKALLLFLLLVGFCEGVTKEVVKVFVPVSYHETDSAVEYGVKGELVQAAVIPRPMVLSGAFPEDLVKAVVMPFRLTSNNPTYEVKEANLFLLCGLQLEAVSVESNLKISIDCENLKIPEVIELSNRQMLTMAVEAVRRTVRSYYSGDEFSSFRCEVFFTRLAKRDKALAELSTTFDVGSNKD